MTKTYKCLFSVLLLSLLAINVTAQAPKREFRSAWIATVANIDWPKTKANSTSAISTQKSELIAYLDKMEEMNMTTVCFQVRSMCDAMYKSSYEPWSSYLTGTRGKDPGWDPLEFCVSECHKRGMEVYAWVNPYRWASSGSLSTWNTDFDAQVKDNDWLITNGTFTVLNPGLAETRDHIVKVCKEIITNYSVEGLIFDDYFYPTGGTAEDSSAPDYDLWKSSGTSLSIANWRRENVDKMVTDVYNMVQEVRPEVRFGIAPPGTAGASASKYGLSIWPGGYDTQYSSLYSDPLSWMNKHILDFVSPQIYWHNDHSMAPFGKIANWWYGLAAHFGNCHCNISVNVYDLAQAMGYQEDLGNTQEHWDEHVNLIKQSRTFASDNGVDAFGSNFYSIQYLCNTYDEHGTYLRDNCFQTKSLVPVVDWKNAPTYDAVENLVYNNGALSWTAVTDGLSTIRYTVYAVPKGVSIESARTTDGFKVQYLQGITYDANFALDAEKKSGYWYAVCVYDGYGYEHAATIIGYSEDDVEEPKILTDDGVYSDKENIELNNLWMLSVRSEFDNISFPEGSNGSFNRSMIASGDYVYISGRTANSSSATAYLDKYNGITGEYVGRITLDRVASVTYYPCNNLIKDSKGNICISNLTMISSGPIVIHKVDLETGALTQIASITSTKQPKGRFDHVSVIGDVTAGNFTVFGVATNTANVSRWTFVNGSCTEEMTTVSQFYPTSATNFGLAPRVIPISEDDIFIDGGNTALTRYTFSTGSRTGSFLANTAMAPVANYNNGGTFFPLGEKYIMVYAYNDASSYPANNFNVVATTDELTFSAMSQLWAVPQYGLGNVDSGTCQASADYVTVEEGKVRFYVYVPGNGISAYQIIDKTVSGIENVNGSIPLAPVDYYNLQGVRIEGDNLTPGLYIRRQGDKATKILVK